MTEGGMENANEAPTTSLPVPSADDQPVEGGVRIPRRWGGGSSGGASTSSTTDSSRGSSLLRTRGDDDMSAASLSSNASSVATFPASSAPANTNTTVTTFGGALNSSGAIVQSRTAAGSGSARAEQRRAGNDNSQAAQGIEDGIPQIPVVVATKPRCVKTGVAPRGRFGRVHRIVTRASKAEATGKFWSGVKPARTNSTLVIPTGGGPPGLSMAALRAAMKLKKKANVIQAKSVMSKYIVDPRTSRMQSWKNWMFVNIMFTVLVTPWRVSFRCPANAFGLTLAAIANISFIVDTVLHFFTAVVTESGLLTERKEIARRYITSWFFLDLVTCLPYTTLLRSVIPASLRVMAPVRGLRLLKLLKVVKVYTLHYEVSPVAMSIGKTLVTVILAAHLLSCFWFWVHCFDDLLAGVETEWKQCGSSTSVASQYLSSFYFIIYTMMTVGYGDQHANPSDKKGLILSVFIQLTGATLFGFIIAATRRIVQFIAPIQKVTTTNLQKISEYALDRRLPDGISSRIKRHFRYFYFKTSVFDERAVMEHVPWQICQEVMSKTHAVAISATGLLQDHDFSPIALMRLARAMKPMELDSGEEAILQEDTVLQAYFVIKGRVEAYMHEEARGRRSSFGGGDADTPPLRQSSYLGVWGPGSMWGLSNIMLGGGSEATFVAASPSDLLWLDQSDLIAAIDEHPDIKACLEKTASTDHHALREAVKSPTITKEGLKLKQITLTDFKSSDLKQQLKHTDVRNLCMAASADQLAAAAASQAAAASHGGMVGMVHDIQHMAAFGGKGVRGRLRSFVGSVHGVLRGQKMQMRLVRTWRGGDYGFGEVLDGTGKVVKGVSETEETPEELNNRAIILPDQPIKLRWDVAISMVCVLVAVLTPYRMAFAHNDALSWCIFDAAVDVVFVIDILLRFRTAYIGNAANNVIVYITVPGMILKNYLRGWMLFDIASTIPGYLFDVSDRVFRGLVVLKLLRIGRVPALAKQLHRLREQEALASGGAKRRRWLRGMNVDVPRWCLDVVQILVVILYASHVFGCFWWVMSRYNNDESWWQRDGLDIDDATSTYIASLYWAATTITTVGYGDLVPTNDLERMIACLTMVCGTTMFSYVIGSVSTLVMNPTGGNVRRNLELKNVENYLEEQKVGAHLGDSVRTHMMFVTGARSAWNEDHILSRLPPRLQERVLEHVHRDAVLIIPILKTRPPSFVSAILKNLRPRQYSQGEVVFQSLHMSQGVYFVTKGIAEAYVRVTGGAGTEEEKVKGIVSTGKFFGYTRFLASFLEEDMAVKAFTQLYVYLLSNSSIRYLLQYHPFLAEELRMGLEEAIFQQASEEIAAENNKLAAKKATYGGKKEGGVAGRKANPGSSDGGGGSGGGGGMFHERRTTALASYLRKESVRVEGGTGARIPSAGLDTSRIRRARDRPEGVGKEGGDENGTEEKRAGNDTPRRLRFRQSGDGVGGGGGGQGEASATQQQEEEQGQGGMPSDSGEEDSLTMPGLGGVIVTQLTWGAGSGAWDAALTDAAGDAAAEGTGAATAAAAAEVGAASTAIETDRAGLVGTTSVALPENVDVHGDDDLGTPATPAADEDWDSSDVESRGVLERGAVQTLDRLGEEEAAGQRGDGGTRRSTFTERLAPLRQSLGDVRAPSLEHEQDARHIPPSTAPSIDRDKSREHAGTPQGESEVDSSDVARR